eukprot:15148279-Ditylum_brightwellii.AAC.1
MASWSGNCRLQWLVYALKLKKNCYRQNNFRRVWYEHLKAMLEEIDFKLSTIDECIFYKGQMIFLCYIDDSIFVGPLK